MNIVTKFPVLVTGGTGFIAGHIIQQLLIKGYKVRTTVRSLSHTIKFQHLFSMSMVDENLEIVEADLIDPLSWTYAFSGGIEYVIHTAGPYILKPDDVERVLVKPIVMGMKTILEMCKLNRSVKKLIITSCICTITDEFLTSKEYTEDDWNNLSSLNRNSYAFCKTVAERSAWTFSQAAPDCQFKVVSILPGLTLGPHLGRGLSFSQQLLFNLVLKLKGAVQLLLPLFHHNLVLIIESFEGIPNFSFCISDVRDVANAHILAMETEHIVGRYCLCSTAISSEGILDIVRTAYPSLQLATKKVSDILVRAAMIRDRTFRSEFVQYNLGRVPNIKCQRAKEVNMVIRPVAHTIIDTIQFFSDHGMLEDDDNEKSNIRCMIT